MRKSIIKISIILMVILSFSSILIFAKTDNIITAEIKSSNNSLDLEYTSNRYTQKDDLEENIYKGSLSENDEEVLTSENGQYTLYINKKLCIFKVRNNTTGYIYHTAEECIYEDDATTIYAASLSSTFAIEYYKYDASKKENILTTATANITTAKKLSKTEKESLPDIIKYNINITQNDDVSIDYQKISNGYKVTINYNKIDITIVAYVTLDNEGFRIKIPDDEIIEDKNLIAYIVVAPTMGATYNNLTKGYMVIPDGSGALIRYGDNSVRNTSQQYIPFYCNNILNSGSLINKFNGLQANIFGLINGIKQDGVYGIIEEGSFLADLIISPCGANNINYNYLTTRYIKRFTSLLYGVTNEIVKSRNAENINVLYKYLSAEKATYVGMANDYREYLLEKEELNKNEVEFKTRIDYLLSEASKGLIGSKNITMTTIDDVNEFNGKLKTNSINTLTILKGWSKYGNIGSTPYNIKLNKDVGSKNEFKELFNDDVYLYNDYQVAYKRGNISIRRDVARSTENLKMSYTNNEVSLFKDFYFLSPSSTKEIALNDIKKYQKLGVQGLALDSIADLLFTYVEDSEHKDRISAYNEYNSLANTLSEKFNISMFEARSYMYKYLDNYLDMSVYAGDYNFYTDSVPLIPYVLRTCVPMYSYYINFNANGSKQALRLVDYGVNPSYIITSEASYRLKYTNSVEYFTTSFNDWYQIILENNELLNKGYEFINEEVIDRNVIDNGVVIVTFSSNNKIKIDYTKGSYEVIYND